MFSISNKLAYNGKMVLADNMKQDDEGMGKWLSTQGTTTTRQYVPEQTETLIKNVKEHITKYLRFQLLEAIKEKLDDLQEMKPLLEDALDKIEFDSDWITLHTKAWTLMQKYVELRNKRGNIELLKEIGVYIEGKYSYPSVFIITPFSIVKEKVKKEIVPDLFEKMKDWLIESPDSITLLVSGYSYNDTISPIIKNFEKFYKGWVRDSIGTVHTFQGKEADIVYFITGTDASTIKAAEWACKEPNLLNVAVTRAKKEFYLIGNQDLLEQFYNYKTIIQELEKHESLILCIA